MKLSLDWYTLRALEWDAFQFIDFCATHQIDSVQLSARRHFKSLREEDLLPAKRRAAERGVQLEIGMGSVNKYASSFNRELGPAEEQLSAVLRAAAFVGSPSVHVVLGGRAERTGPVPLEQQIEECVRVARAVAPLARDLGVKLAFETHGDLLGRELAQLVAAAGPDTCGVCLDTGNPSMAAEDPLLTTELLARYTMTGHIRDSRIWAVPGGAMVQHVPVGQGNVDMRRIAALLKEQAPPGAVFGLEILTGSPPRFLPYFDPQSDFWKPYPKMLARDLARFHALAMHGKPEPLEQVVAPRGADGSPAPPPAALAEQLRAQALRHLEESVRYCRDVLGVGERDRSPGTASGA
ncbi:MAG TPA: sugar phosphate isomerase/epimerase family protein [Chloroflexota bacterium]|nr:sugar phosphate isomerase/epimerase family protein [Chloroflexota bacterium]